MKYDRINMKAAATKKTALILVVAMIMMNAVFTQVIYADGAATFIGGGTVDSPYLINDAKELKMLADLVNAGNGYEGKHFAMTSDIDLSEYRDGEGWVPIGKNGAPFMGTFDGRGYVVTNLKISSYLSSQGLFGRVGKREGATMIPGYVKNLGVINCNIIAEWALSVGAIAGEVNYGSIENCFSTGNISGYYQVGGIAGYISGSVKNCYSTAAVSGYSNVGGIAGKISDNGAQLETCFSTGSISGYGDMGGIVGSAYGGIVLKNCVALNSSITEDGIWDSAAGRVVGSSIWMGVSPVISDNIAWSGIKVNGEITNDSSNNGAGRTAEELAAGPWSGFSDEGGWIYTEGELPKLRGLSKQNNISLDIIGDRVPPVAEDILPKDDKLPVGGELHISFSKEMDQWTIGEISISSGDINIDLSDTAQWQEDKRTISVSYSDISYETEYTLNVQGFKNLAGDMMESVDYIFTTVDTPETPVVSPAAITIKRGETALLSVYLGKGSKAATGAAIMVGDDSIAETEVSSVTTSGAIMITGKRAGSTDITVTFNDASNTQFISSVTVEETPRSNSGSKPRNMHYFRQRAEYNWPATVLLEHEVLNELINNEADGIHLSGDGITVSLDIKALRELKEKSTGDIEIKITPVQKPAEGVVNAYDISVSWKKSGKYIKLEKLDEGYTGLNISYDNSDTNVGEENISGVYVDQDGSVQFIQESYYDVDNHEVRIITRHLSIYGAAYKSEVKFKDIENHWAQKSICYAWARGILKGTADDEFSPDLGINSGMMVTLLKRMTALDVEEYFNPDKLLSREETAYILMRYAKATGFELPYVNESIRFQDYDEIRESYKEAVSIMQGAGIMMGRPDNGFYPSEGVTRAETAEIIRRYIKLKVDAYTD